VGKSDHRRLCTFRIGSGKKQKKKNNLEESGPLRLAKTVFELDKHPFRDANYKNWVDRQKSRNCVIAKKISDFNTIFIYYGKGIALA